MNPLYRTTTKGTLGELIVQTHLLAYGVQAAPPIKDSGNDLIGLCGRAVRSIQVKTSQNKTVKKPNSRILYEILAFVHLPYDHDDNPLINHAEVYLFPVDEVNSGTLEVGDRSRLSRRLVSELWQVSNSDLSDVPPRRRLIVEEFDRTWKAWLAGYDEQEFEAATPHEALNELCEFIAMHEGIPTPGDEPEGPAAR